MDNLEKEYALVLAGGGTKGSYQVGVWKALKELGINVTLIVGASIGTINGALIMQDNIDEMIELYEHIEADNIMEISDKINTDKNLLSLTNIKELAKEYIENKGIENTPLRDMINKYIDIDKIYNSNIDFGLVTYSINEKKPLQIFKNEIPKEEMVDFLLASSCFPIFKAQKISGSDFIDGGVYDNTPINMAIEKGYKNIIVADVSGVGMNRKMVNKDVYLKIISAKEPLGGTFNFNHEQIKSNIALGYLDTMKSFNKLQGHIYYFPQEEFNNMLDVFNLQTVYGLENAAKIYKMEKYKIYTFEEFITELNERHKEAKEKYIEVKKLLQDKRIGEIKAIVNNILNGELGICFATDLYLEKPMSKKFNHLKRIVENYIEAMNAMIELENYLK